MLGAVVDHCSKTDSNKLVEGFIQLIYIILILLQIYIAVISKATL